MLDRLILYLRLVHSVDFYNNGEYPHEDDLPNRCGLIHVRGPVAPPNQNPDEGPLGAVLTETKFGKELTAIGTGRMILISRSSF